MVFQQEVGLGNHLRKTFKRYKVYNINDYFELVDLHNTRLNVYQNANPYNDITNYSTIRLEKIPLDIDKNHQTALEIFNFLCGEDIVFDLFFSGSKDSYHFYVHSENGNISNPKASLLATQQSVIDKVFGWNKLNNEWKESEYKYFSDFMRLERGIDTQIFGDIARLFRVPNTLNLKSLHYCIPVQQISEENNRLSLRQCFSCKTFEGKKIKLKNCSDYKSVYGIDYGDIEPPTANGCFDIKDLDVCVREMIMKPRPSHEERYIATYELIDFICEGCFNYESNSEKEIIDKIFCFFNGLRKNNKHIWDDYNPTLTKYHIAWCVRKKHSRYTCEQKKARGLCLGCGKDEK